MRGGGGGGAAPGGGGARPGSCSLPCGRFRSWLAAPAAAGAAGRSAALAGARSPGDEGAEVDAERERGGGGTARDERTDEARDDARDE